MHKPATYRYKNGKWIKSKPPAWFVSATKTDEAWVTSFTAHKVRAIEEFDCGDSIEIFKAPDDCYCIVFRDCERALAVVFIGELSDYIQFRADVVAPNVRLMMASEQLDERAARQFRRAS